MPYACPVNGTSGSLKSSQASLKSTTSAINTTPQVNNPSKIQLNPKKDPSMFQLYNDEEEDDEDEDEDEDEEPLSIPKRNNSTLPRLKPKSQPITYGVNQTPIRHPLIHGRSSTHRHNLNAGGISKLTVNVEQILKFPKESTHAYSYAHLAPNSLSVRLSILKRSLEILLDRPDLLNNKENEFGFNNSAGLNLDIDGFINQVSNDKEENERKISISSNASSAALSALFYNSNSNANSSSGSSSKSSLDKSAHVGLKTLIKILKENELKDDNTTTKKALAKNLHDLSLSTYLNDEDENSESQLKVKLLHAVATPFYESVNQTPLMSLNTGASTLALSSLQNNQSSVSSATNSKFFHSSQRNTPQAVVTCELNDPWNLKAANDLSCLIFGVSKNSLRILTLLDLISPDSRDFVFNRLIENSLTKNDIIFSGEIVAIAKSGNKLTWASLWAKKKGNLIICMFDQVPCDSIDLIVNFDGFNIDSFKKISGGAFFNNISAKKNMNELINNFGEFIENSRIENTENIPKIIFDSYSINEKRYFTIKKSGFNIPCAIASTVIDENDSIAKLKIHTMPYIAGVFVISAEDYKLLSFNESISKNLFGLNEKQLLNGSINKIIPNFEKIMKFITNNLKNLKIIPGLVLPEHFFRQIDCLVNNQKNEAFLNSVGLDAIHADGSIIKVDIQLRCPQVDTLLLWITHSRSVFSNKFEKKGVTFHETTKDEDSNSSLKHNKQSSIGSEDSEFEDHGELPSQLSLLKEHEIQSISRSSSVRSNFHTASSSASSTTSVSTNSISSKRSNVDIKELTTLSTEDSNEHKKPGIDLETYKILDSSMSEETLLKIENETIQRHKSRSKYYPKTIGLARRDKSFTEFKILKKMGQGAYGKVVLAENKQDSNYRVVIKLIIKERILVDTWVRDRKLGTIPSEIQVMATLNDNPHPNIMRLIDFFEDDDYYYIETPPHGFPSPAIDLFDLIELKESMSELECKSIIKQAVSAVNHLHKYGVVHRDIKDENLIIDSNGVIKLIDFGSAAYIKQGPFDVFVGTLDYAAPEVLNGQPYDGKPQDVWSMGILIYTLIYKENPFYNVDEIMEGELRIPFIMSPLSLKLIEKILQRDIKLRPTITEILDDDWLKE